MHYKDDDEATQESGMVTWHKERKAWEFISHV